MDTEGVPVREIVPDFYYRMQCGIMYAETRDQYSRITIWEVVTRTATTFRVPFRVTELAATTRYGFAFGNRDMRNGKEKQLFIQFELNNPGRICRFVFKLKYLKVKIYGVEYTREKVRLSMNVFYKVLSKAKWIAATEKFFYFVGINRFSIYEFIKDSSSQFENFKDRQRIKYRSIRALPYEKEFYGANYMHRRREFQYGLRNSPCPSPALSFGDAVMTEANNGKDSVKYIACGSNHVTILTVQGLVLAYGSNTKEELGLHVGGVQINQLIPNTFLTDLDTFTKTLSIGYFHGAGVGIPYKADRNISLTWGLNPYNQLNEEIGEISMAGAVCVMRPRDEDLRINDVVCEGNQTSYYLGEVEPPHKTCSMMVCGDEEHWVL